MSLNILNLSDNYDKNELNTSYVSRLDSLRKTNLTEFEKLFYSKYLSEIYNQKSDELNKKKTSTYSYHRKYKERLLEDGSIIVIEKNKINNNGKIDTKVESYKMKNGQKIPIEYSDAYKQIDNDTYFFRKNKMIL